MTKAVRKLLVASAVLAGGVLGTGGPVTAKNGLKGGTPFSVSARLACDGKISWSATVGTQALQAVWVKVDFVTTIALASAPLQGTYSGFTGGFDPRISHTVLLRRVVGAKVEEQALVTTGACVG